MKRINSDRFAKSVLVLFLVGVISGCGDQPEETAKQNQPEITSKAAQSNESAVEPGLSEAGEAAEATEESLESILARADEIIQRTGSAVNAEGDDVKHELEETAGNFAEKADSVLAETPKVNEAIKETVNDGLEVVKATPDLIRKIQKALKDAGLNPGAADGMMGPRTQNALVDFQKQHGLAEGKITKETLRELGITF
ncbi:Putative peptidoglycan binding domain-containing protein [Nitrosomonas eutropha]|nr:MULTISPECIES: peptidoglycan-binding domain-containing protein [Nitrosomonas]MXS80444.1 peptidoglycan-binding protein [Nitrosomonas sp. GH22]SCX16909.1 Putative peptidoglycan binding domain-containing protein [Nitrosomonas eutropha]SDW51816.1 Putative peptidoglycan binding domain-containing protein [Nitrosomonas eutropha]